MRTFAGMKLNSLKDLKLVKGKLAEESRPTAAGPSSAPAANQPRNRTVVHPSRAEERARNEGLSKGQKVRLMDSSDMGTITGFGDGYYEIDLDGMVIRAVRREFVPVEPDEDRQLYTSIPSGGRFMRTQQARSRSTCISSAFRAAKAFPNGPRSTTR